MSALHKIIMSSLVLLCLVACSEDESSEEVLFRLDENGVVFSKYASITISPFSFS